MNIVNRLATISAGIMLALPLAAAVAQPPPPQGNPTQPRMPLEYAVKFVCGRVVSPGQTAMAPMGNYYTAINVHNPGLPTEFTHKATLALLGNSGSPGRMTPFQPYIGIRYDEAMDFDCSWIRQRLAAAGVAVPAFFTGFFVLQSARELDVVAVYTAAPTTTGQVATMHMERVPMRRVM